MLSDFVLSFLMKNVAMLSVMLTYRMAEYCYARCHYAECCYAESSYAKCCHAE